MLKPRSAHNALQFTLATTAVILALGLPTPLHAQTTPDSLAATVTASGITTGLCVVLPTQPGAALGTLAQDGKFVVQGLALSDAEVTTTRAAIPPATHGLATVRTWTPGTPLPYADSLVDLLVVDADALGTRCPSDADLLRVVVPQTGALRIRRQGVWTTLTAPKPATFGSWSHYYGDATGNPVSTDNVPGPANALQWIGESPAGMAQQQYTLVDGNIHLTTQFDAATQRNMLLSRSAFNGFHNWTKNSAPKTGRYERNGPVVNLAGRIYTLLAADQGPLVALDAVTGAEVLRFAGTLPALTKTEKCPTHPGNLAVWDDVVLLARADQVLCWDRKTGALRWTFDGKGRNIAFPAVDTRNRRVGILMAKDTGIYMAGDRETSFWPTEIISLSLADGREAWRVPYPFAHLEPSLIYGQGVAPGRTASAFLWAQGAFYMNMSKGLEKTGIDIGAIDAATGATRWLKPNLTRWAGGEGDAVTGVGSLLVYPQAVVLTRSSLLLYDPASGNSLGEWRMGNSRCDNGRGAAWGFSNFGHYLTWDAGTHLTAQRVEIARNNCGGAASHANGMLYYQPQVCGCFTPVRGMLALSRQKPGALLPDAQRLLPGPALNTKPTRQEAPGDWPTLLGDQRRAAAGSELTSTALREHWRVTVATPRHPGANAGEVQTTAAYNGPLSAPVIAGGLILVSEPDAHRLHARDATSGKPVWTATVGGRIDTPPTIAGGRVYAGSRDGWVTCFDLASGQIVWRFCAARNARQIGAWGQVESAWPVHGTVVVANGTVIITAGYHPDADGGMLVWGLDATSGAIRWQRSIASTRETVAMDPAQTTTGSSVYFTANRVENGIPSCDGTVAVLPGLRLTVADGTGTALLGGRPAVDRKGEAAPTPAFSGMLVSNWGMAAPWLRSAIGNFDGPGDVLGKQGYRVGEASPRRAAWNSKFTVALRMKSSDLLLFDSSVPIGSRYNDSRVMKANEAVPNVGLYLASIDLSGKLVNKPAQYGPSTLDPSAMILAGNTAIIAWAPDATNTPRAGQPHQNRPESILQIIDLAGRKIVSTTPVKPGVIDHGLATAHGLLYMVHDDGTVTAWGE
ncbi:MAG: PQQ-binding-like beta-propeller repeat protein [Phycisphaerae bacterium]